MLNHRRQAHANLSFDEQAAVNAERMVPVVDLHDILTHVLTHGHCRDELLNGNGVKVVAAA